MVSFHLGAQQAFMKAFEALQMKMERSLALITSILSD